jgi:selenide,water dikinase
MLRASAVDATLDPAAIPALDGAAELLASGIASTLHPANEAFRRHVVGEAPPLLFDPQTAGGLLAGVPAERAGPCLAALRRLGYEAAIVGACTARAGAEPAVRLARPESA